MPKVAVRIVFMADIFALPLPDYSFFARTLSAAVTIKGSAQRQRSPHAKLSRTDRPTCRPGVCHRHLFRLRVPRRHGRGAPDDGGDGQSSENELCHLGSPPPAPARLLTSGNLQGMEAPRSEALHTRWRWPDCGRAWRGGKKPAAQRAAGHWEVAGQWIKAGANAVRPAGRGVNAGRSISASVCASKRAGCLARPAATAQQGTL
jgi:hypothetical protein